MRTQLTKPINHYYHQANMFNVLINSAGQATRLAHLLQNGQLSKCQVSLAGEPAILRQLRYWHEQADFNKAVVLCDSKHKAGLRLLLDMFDYRNVHIVCDDAYTGTANGIASALRQLAWLKDNGLIIQWADLLPLESLPAFNKHFTACFVQEGQYRYKAIQDNKPMLVGEGELGNVPGIYYLPYPWRSWAKEHPEGTDFADLLYVAQAVPFKVLDFGDATKHCIADSYLASKEQSKDMLGQPLDAIALDSL